MEHQTKKSGRKFLKYKPRFSRKLLALYAVIIGGIGGYLIWHSLALGTVPKYDHVVIVLEENHIASAFIGSSNAPYINSLIPDAAVFTNSQAITHPSQPNYLDLFSGSDQGVNGDACPHTYSVANLGSELISAGYSFTGYAEGLPNAGSSVCSSGEYERKHAPWTNFTNIPNGDSQPFSAFPTDYSQLPTFSFVTPDMIDDAHDGTVAQADTWLKNNLNGYIQWAQTHNSLFIFTTDEGRGSNQNIATFMVGQGIKPGSYTEALNHFGVLRTLEDMYGLTLLGQSASQSAITDAWTGSTSGGGSTGGGSTGGGGGTTGGGGSTSGGGTDTQAPTISIASPANNATVSGTVTLKATASDNVGVTAVQFTLGGPDGGDLGPQLLTPPFNYSWDTTSAMDGTYTLTAVAYDAAGNQGVSSTVNVTVSNGSGSNTTGGGTGTGNTSGDITLNGGKTWICNGPVNLDSVTITNPTGDGAFLRSGCTGTIKSLVITGTSHDGLHVNAGAHDLTIESGMIRCVTPPGVGTPQHFHQDGIQAMGGGPNITFENFDDQCLTANNSAMFINEGAGGNSLPTGIVCNHCILNSGTTATVKIYNSKDSGVENSTIYQGKNTWVQITSGATSPVNTSNQELPCPQTRTLNCGGQPNPGGGGSGGGGDTTPPTVSVTAPADGASVSGSNVTVSANASDNVGVTGVQFQVDGKNIGAEDTTSPYSVSWDSTGLSNGSHDVEAIAYDAAGNQGTDSVTVTVSNGDTTPPSAPTGLTASAASATKVNLSWTASTDNVGVTGYYIVRDGTTIAQTSGTGTTYSDTTVSPSTAYKYQVMAFDAKGNRSTASGTASVTTPSGTTGGDTTAPSAPTKLVAAAAGASQINLSWTASTDNVGVTGYDIYMNGTKIGSSKTTSYGVSGLNSLTTYSFYVIARDAAGNSSQPSNTASATTADVADGSGTITGKVKNKSGQALWGVVVRVGMNGHRNTYITNKKGVYKTQELPEGTYNVKFRYSNYQPQTFSLNVNEDVVTTKNVTLLKH